MAATINDKVYGKLVWDADFGEGWNGKVEFEPGVWIEISIWNPDPMDFLAAQATHEIYRKICANKDKILKFLADNLHQGYNDEWRTEGQKWLNRTAFLEQIKWSSIAINQDKTSYIMFKTDLFESYTPVVNLDQNCNCESLELV